MLLPVFLLLTLAACPTASSHSQSQPKSAVGWGPAPQKQGLEHVCYLPIYVAD